MQYLFSVRLVFSLFFLTTNSLSRRRYIEKMCLYNLIFTSSIALLCNPSRAEPKCSKKRCQTNWECYFRIRESICCRCIAHAQIKHLKNICDCIPTNKNVFSFEMTVYLLAICRLHLRFSRTHTNRSIWYWLQPASVVQHVQHSLNKIFMLCWNKTLYIGRSFESVLLSEISVWNAYVCEMKWFFVLPFETQKAKCIYLIYWTKINTRQKWRKGRKLAERLKICRHFLRCKWFYCQIVCNWTDAIRNAMTFQFVHNIISVPLSRVARKRRL